MRNKRLLHETLARPLPRAAVDRPKQTFTLPFAAWMDGELQPFRDLGWLIYDEGRLRLTRAGMLLAHEIMAVFIRPAAGPSS